PTQKIGVAAAVVAAAVTVYEAGVIYRQQATLETARAQATALTTEIAELRAARKRNANRLKLVQAQLNARLAQTTAIAPEAGDTALESQMQTWLAQLAQLKRFLTDQPRFNIPELQFLSEQDWFAIAAGAQLNSDEDFRRTSAGLRNRAEGIFA